MNRSPPASSVAQAGFTVATRGRGFTDITREVADAVASSRVQTGVANVFTLHTSCSLLLSENADPAVRDDLERWFARAVPDGDPLFRHDAEGPDDMPISARSLPGSVSACRWAAACCNWAPGRASTCGSIDAPRTNARSS